VEKEISSFRDPSGFVFAKNGVLYRQVNQVYKRHYDLLISSGLYDALRARHGIVSHEEADVPPFSPDSSYKIIRPDRIPFISYPYEWCFSQLKDAALLTLEILKTALDHGMVLKDASAYNIQFREGRPILIDTLSFEEYREGTPWVAYRQFCQHFLAPLALMSKVDIRTGHLLRSYIDGIPLNLASRLLPFSSRLSVSILMHIHLHARSIKKYEDGSSGGRKPTVRKSSLLALVESLAGLIRSLQWKPGGTEWAEYYNDTNYGETDFEFKRMAVERYVSQVAPNTVWDFGGNTGRFTRTASDRGIFSLCFDIDPAAVEKNYLAVKRQNEKNLLPLVLDLTNPSPGLGWENTERKPIRERGHADLVLALALVHHLCIGNNVPLGDVAGFFALRGDNLVVEFVPKEDSQVRRLLASREDVFADYDQGNFEKQFARHYDIADRVRVGDTRRCLYLMTRAAACAP
jgi:ribosomal protein L11 methylase PrmA